MYNFVSFDYVSILCCWCWEYNFETNETSGSAGFITALMFLSGGITMIDTRNSEKKGGIIANIILFSLGALVGFANAGTYSDLKVWSTICIILAIINSIPIIWKKKDKNE